MNTARKALGLRSFGFDAVLFILGGLVALVPAAIPTDWDSCQFVLGLHRFSPPDHQPHPPGYFFFLLVARGIQFLVADPHRALSLTSALAAALLPVAVRRLAARLIPHRPDIALGAGILTLAAPARLFFGAQALAYTWEGLLATLLVSLALDLHPETSKNVQSGSAGASPAWLLWAALWAVAGGFRPNLLLFFLPLAVILALNRRWWENLLALLILVAITLAWLIPTALASGGLTRFLLAVKGHGAYFLLGGLGWERILDNTRALSDTGSAITGMHLVLWAALGIVAWSIARLDRPATPAFTLYQRKALWWIFVPMFLFHLFIFYTIRYSLLYVPILLPLLAYLAARLFEWKPRSLRIGWAVPVLICIVSWWAFLMGHSPYSLGHLKSLGRETRFVADAVRELGDQETVTIVAGRNFRTWGMALEEYTIYFPMHALYSPELNPRLAAMRNGDTVRGDFYMPGAPESESLTISMAGQPSPDHIIVLDEDAYRVLVPDRSGWNSERITSRENLYWRSFPGGCLLVDREGELVLVPLEGTE